MKHIFLALFMTVACTLGAAPTPITNPMLLQQAITLPQEGTLKQTANGFVYVDVSDHYIHKLQPLVKGKDIFKPPYFSANSVGAHISVIPRAELLNHGIHQIAELGEKIHFTTQSLFYTSVLWPNSDVDGVYFLEVKSPRLEQLRKRYGMSPFIRGHEFHITVAVHEVAKKHFQAQPVQPPKQTQPHKGKPQAHPKPQQGKPHKGKPQAHPKPQQGKPHKGKPQAHPKPRKGHQKKRHQK